jgi:hypothetical protein
MRPVLEGEGDRLSEQSSATAESDMGTSLPGRAC